MIACSDALPRLREYQRSGVNFLLERHTALLADEMGLGKTVQAIVALRILLRDSNVNRTLVVTPASLRLNWEKEFGLWAPELAIRRLEGDAEDRAAHYMLPVPVLIASYEQIRADSGAIRADLHYDVVVADEVQRLKNVDSRTSLACRAIPRLRTWALTGTPMENTVEDLTAVWGFIKLNVARRGMTKRELHEAIQPYFLRRRKAEVLSELPPIIEQNVYLELSSDQQAAYDSLWDSRRAIISNYGKPVKAIHLLALITRLKQVCNFDFNSGASTKLEELQLIVENLEDIDDKILVFSQYVETLRWLSSRLGITCDIFHGDLTDENKDAVLTKFRAQPGPRALLVSLRAGGVGLNLQEASTVVLFDRWWNPASEMQAIQRAHRYGRTRPLHVFKFIIKNTIEERIADLLNHKQGLFEEYVDDAPQQHGGTLSLEQLYHLLALSPPA